VRNRTMWCTHNGSGGLMSARGTKWGSPQRLEPALSTVLPDSFHGDGRLAAPATFLKPELRQRFGHPGSPPENTLLSAQFLKTSAR
jgi:hypothetical protein